MRRLFLATGMLASMIIHAQPIDSAMEVTRYVAWLTPVGKKSVTIDGVAIGLMALPSRVGHLKINGLNVEVLPMAVFTVFGGIIWTMVNVMPIPENDLYADSSPGIRTEIHGLSISAGMFEDVKMNGVSLNLVNSYVTISEGVEISFIMNSNYQFSGAQLSMFGNRAVEGKGVQVGMFNSCDHGRVFQFGFLNRIGKRVLPIINFSLKKKQT